MALPLGLCGVLAASYAQQVNNSLVLLSEPIDACKRDTIVLTFRNDAKESALIDPGDVIATMTLMPAISRVPCGRVEFFPPHLFRPIQFQQAEDPDCGGAASPSPEDEAQAELLDGSNIDSPAVRPAARKTQNGHAKTQNGSSPLIE